MITAAWQQSRQRWRNAQPDNNLTWFMDVTGDAFVARAQEYGAFAPETRVLEIGPGYGRVLTAMREQPFASYLGVDISAANVQHLRGAFRDERVAFHLADAETMVFHGHYDLLLSSLVFKHLYPTFEATLRNCVAALAANALVCFDLLDGHQFDGFEVDEQTYVQGYTSSEASVIVEACGLQVVDVATVVHDSQPGPGSSPRLFVVARKLAA